MHYRNGREAKNGDHIVSLESVYDKDGKLTVRINAMGILYDPVAGNDYCNGYIAPTLGGLVRGACLCDCLHVDDIAAFLKEKGLDKRPEGK